jgi:hypothetical protein
MKTDMRTKTTITALALLLGASPAFAQGADDPGYQMIDGVGACVLGGGSFDKTREELTRLGWTVEVDGEMGIADFRPATGNLVSGFVTAQGDVCVVESSALSTEDAQSMFNLFFMGGNSGIEVTESGTDADGCTTHTLSNGGVATMTSGGQDPTCASEESAAVRFAYPAN